MPNTQTPPEWLFALVIIFWVCVIVFIVRRRKKHGNKGKLNQAVQDLLSSQTELIANGVLAVAENSPIIKKPNEIVHWLLPANRLITKNKAVGRTGRGAGVSVRVAKGLSVHSGGGNSRTIYNDVTSSFGGLLVFTNQRLVFVNNQQGFEVMLQKLTSITEMSGNLLIQSSNKTFTLSTKGNRLCVDTVHLILQKQKEAAQ